MRPGRWPRRRRRRAWITIAGFNFIQNPVHALALKTIQNGEIGEIKFARLFFNGDFLADPNLQHSWRNDKKLAGSGVIGDIGAHCFSYFRHLVGKEIDQVFCDLEIVVPDHPAPLDGGSFRIGAQGDQNNRIPNTTDDVANVLFKFPGGSGVMENSRISAGIRYDIGYDLIGTKGSLRYTYDRINDLYINRGNRAGRVPWLYPCRDGAQRSAIRRSASGLGSGLGLQRLQGNRSP